MKSTPGCARVSYFPDQSHQRDHSWRTRTESCWQQQFQIKIFSWAGSGAWRNLDQRNISGLSWTSWQQVSATLLMKYLYLLLQGILTSETRCLNCETVTSKDEEFCDLSIDVDQVRKCYFKRDWFTSWTVQNTSVTNCLRNFSSTETLSMENKFKCDTCCSYQVRRTAKKTSLEDLGLRLVKIW